MDFSDQFSVENWITKYDLICYPKAQIAYFGGLLLAGFFVGSVFFVRIGDIIGRRPVILASTILSTFSLFGCQYFAPNLTALFIYIFLFGVTIGPRCFLSYVLGMELTPKEHHTLYATFSMLVDSACMIFLGIYFYIVRSMEGLITGLAVAQILIITLLWIFMPESPKFFYEQGKIDQFAASLRKIAGINGKVPEQVINMEEIRNISSSMRT